MSATIKIITVDDAEITRRGLALFFRKGDIKIIGEAENGEELFILLKTKKPDVVLLDLQMPKLNGSQSLNRLQKEFPEIKVIILSKYHDEELIKDMFNRGASAFISKITCSFEFVGAVIKWVAANGLYKENMSVLLKTPAEKDGHYYSLILSRREIQVMGLICKSKSYKQIGNELFISENTVENHAKSIYKKTGAKNRAEFGMIATDLGLKYIGNEI